MFPASKTKRFFEYFHSFLEKNGLLNVHDFPDAFYNLDETNFELNLSMKRVLSRKGAKTIYKVDSSRPKENITAWYCFGANDSVYKNQVLLKEKFTWMEDLAVASGTINGDFLFTQTKSGWEIQRSFKDYIQN